MGGHTTAHIGKRIHVILKTGKHFNDKLKDMRSKYYVFKTKGKVNHSDVRSFSIFRGKKGDKTT